MFLVMPSMGPKSHPLVWCNNDICEVHYRGAKADEVAFGCYLCDRATRHSELDKNVKKQVPLWDLAAVGRTVILPCPKHQGNLGPHCPVSGDPLDAFMTTPPTGMWAEPAGGKTVIAAVLHKVISNHLYEAAGITSRALRDHGDYESSVVRPLFERGVLPQKTDRSVRHSTVLLFERRGAPLRKIALNDLAGETFAKLNSSVPVTPEIRLGRALMLHSRRAMLLANPQNWSGIGARITPDLWPAVVSCFNALQDASVDGLDFETARNLPQRIANTLRAWQFPVCPASRLAAAVAALTGADPTGLDTTVSQCVEDARRQPPLLDQVRGATTFLDTYHADRDASGKFDARLALTVTKSDLLCGAVELPDYHRLLRGLGQGSSPREWFRALENASREAERILCENGEKLLVEELRAQFHRVGFFFASALGREPEPEVVPVAQSAPNSSLEAPEWAETTAPAPAPLESGRRWELSKRLGLNSHGTYEPEPEGVLWPLLWLLYVED